MFASVTLPEWTSARAPVESLTEPDRVLAERLRSTDGGRVIVDERHDGVWITSRSWVGVIRFSEFEISVVPKLAGGNVGVVRMLDYASGVDALRRYDTVRQLDAIGNNLLELIAWLFADGCDRILSDGLLSDYVEREDALHVLRGRLRVMAQVQSRFGRVDPLEVEFDEFETDIPENQVLAAALEATRSIVRTPGLQRQIRRLHSIFHEAANPADLDPLLTLDELTYNRRNDHYRYAHLLAELLLRRLSVRDLFSPGGTTCFAFLLDMNQLFERFVTRLVTDAIEPLGVRVHSQRRDTSIIIDEGTGKKYAAIIPDLLLERRERALTVRLPVDAKYKLYDDRKINESDVYQTFFYAFAYAPEACGARPARAVILYPRAGANSDSALRVDTHSGTQSARIQAFGVDIDAALDSVARGQPTITSIPAVGRVLRVFNEVRLDAQSGPGGLATSA